MKCNICGAEYFNGESICKYCGNTLISAQDRDIPPVSPAANTQPSNEQSEPKKLNYCSKCGRPLNKLTGKCDYCIASAQQQIHPEFTYEEQEEEDMAASKKGKHQKKKDKKKPIKFLLLLIILVVLFLVTALLCFKWADKWLNGGKASETASSSSSTEVVTATEQATETPEIATSRPTQRPTEKPFVKATARPTEKPVHKPTVTEPPKDEPEDVINYYGGEYLYPTYEKVITNSELDKLERDEIKLILQEIYARHGFTFNDDDLVEYFESQSWYLPTTTSTEEAEAEFNSYEKQNVEKIEAYQRKMGWRI